MIVRVKLYEPPRVREFAGILKLAVLCVIETIPQNPDDPGKTAHYHLYTKVGL